jgi:hypothetical protein
MQFVHHRNPYSALPYPAAGRYPTVDSLCTNLKWAQLLASTKVPTKEDFDWLCYQMTGFMRTQILSVAACIAVNEE